MEHQTLDPSLHKTPHGQHHQVIQTGNSIGYDKVPAQATGEPNGYTFMAATRR